MGSRTFVEDDQTTSTRCQAVASQLYQGLDPFGILIAGEDIKYNVCIISWDKQRFLAAK